MKATDLAQSPYGPAGALVRKWVCAGADDCFALATKKTEKVFHRLLREFAIYLSTVAVIEISAKLGTGDAEPPVSVWEALREAILFGKEDNERIRDLLPLFLAAACNDERLTQYLRGDLDGLGISQSDIDRIAEHDLARPDGNRNARAYYGFVTRVSRWQEKDLSATLPVTQLDTLQSIIKKHTDAFHADLSGFLSLEIQNLGTNDASQDDEG
jgi:hypothetical protein